MVSMPLHGVANRQPRPPNSDHRIYSERPFRSHGRHTNARFATYPCGCSRRNPCLPEIPALEQPARWWPKASSGRPHMQLRRQKAAKEEDPEQLQLNPGLHVARRRVEIHPSSWATLRAHQLQLTVRKKWEKLRHSEILFHAGRGIVLPSAPLCPRFEVLWSSWRRPQNHTRGSQQTSTIHGCPPRWEGCGWPDTTTTHKKSTAHSNMVAEQVLTYAWLNVRPG